MTIEQLWSKYENKQHLIGTLPKSAYVKIMLYGLALQEQMERTMREVESVTAPRMPSKAPACPQDEKIAKGSKSSIPAMLRAS